jgi:hypothetical protein
MPVFQIGLDDGRSLRIEADDQAAALAGVQHFQENEKPAAPSGVGAGFVHGVKGVFSGPAATAGLISGAPDTPADPNYKSAPIFDKDGIHPGNIMQSLAEAAPGLTADILAGKAGASLGSKVGGVRGGVVGGLGGFLGSSILRNFGHGAHENADAETGVPNSPVTGGNVLREVAKQGIEAVPNMLLGGRYVPGAGKALAEAALTKLGKTGLIGAGTGAANDVIDQLGTTAGSKEGLKYDPYRTANSAATGALLNTALATPRAAGEATSNFKHRDFETDAPTKAATVDLANRLTKAADGEKLVGPLGGTKKGTDVRDRVHAGIHDELSAATKGEDLGVDNASTLKRINEGGTASQSELKSLSDEASPETMRLARLALVSSKLKGMGDTGGLSGSMEGLGPIARPATYIGGAVLGSGIPGTGHLALPALAGVYGTYGAARAIDKMAGLRSPAEGLMKRYADPSVPIRTPEAPNEPQTTSVPQVAAPSAPAQPWGTPAPKEPSLRAELNTNAKLEEGLAKIAKGLGDAKKKSLTTEPMDLLKQLAIKIKPVTADEPAPAPEAPQAPNLSPVAMMMLKQKLKQGLPPEPVAPPPAPPPAPEAPQISPVAMKMTQARMKAGLPPTPPAPVSPVPNAGPPASPAISALMQKLQGQSAPTAIAAPVGPEPTAPVPPVISKILKKAGKPVEAQQAPEAEQPYTPIPEEGLWRKHLSDEQVADAELNSYGPKVREKYGKNVITNRENKRDFAEGIANDHTPADANVAAELYHQLDTISRRTEARKAINHYTKHMTAAAAQAVRDHFTQTVMKEMWRTE